MLIFLSLLLRTPLGRARALSLTPRPFHLLLTTLFSRCRPSKQSAAAIAISVQFPAPVVERVSKTKGERERVKYHLRGFSAASQRATMNPHCASAFSKFRDGERYVHTVDGYPYVSTGEFAYSGSHTASKCIMRGDERPR